MDLCFKIVLKNGKKNYSLFYVTVISKFNFFGKLKK
jgi:hypothetical protein